MTYSEPARTTTCRIPKILVAGLLVVITAIAAALGYQLPAPSSSTAASPIDVLRNEHRGAALATRTDSPHAGGPRDSGPAPTPSPARLRQRAEPGKPGEPAQPSLLPSLPIYVPTGTPIEPGAAAPGGADPRAPDPSPPPHRGALDEADGAVPDGTTVFDDENPGVANLDQAFLGALRQAATDAADDGVAFDVESGWRSPEYQEQLLHEAVSKYGSEEEAARWVATPNTSAHVSGDAVDIGPFDARAWLSEHGARYGLCQIYINEPWHYELHPKAIDHGCPPMYADPTHDPRMQQ
jgi:D-alanyl-D-alanine carboxypeptidase